MVSLFFLSENTYLFSLLIISYLLAIILAIRILLDNKSPANTLAYLLLFIIFPVIGIIFYLLLGINYRKTKRFKRKLLFNKQVYKHLQVLTKHNLQQADLVNIELLQDRKGLVQLINTDTHAPLTSGNKVKLLNNGEEMFPALLAALEKATHHIHLECYIFEPDQIGNQIKAVLCKKAKQGIKVRFIFDDFGSKHLNARFMNEVRAAGVHIHPFYRIYFPFLANRINYRDHRKIIIIDGIVAFVGGMNVADRYINTTKAKQQLKGKKRIYFRDAHVMIAGSAVHSLQYLFLSNWSFASNEKLQSSHLLFPTGHMPGQEMVQISASGPDSVRSTIMLTYLTAISTAEKSILITTPYFIPNESIYNALRQAALTGKDVRLLVPAISDTLLVNLAASSYFEGLLEVGIRIFLYEKGFIHAKTMVVDDNLSIVGTANMDLRSFDLNFEVNAIVYGTALNQELQTVFYNDLKHAQEITLSIWQKRSKTKRLLEGVARLLSPIL